MRLSKTVSITLPPEMLARAVRMAKHENRTMSELVREALRRYEHERVKDRIEQEDYDDIVEPVKDTRSRLWEAYKKSARPSSKRKVKKA